MINSSQLVVIDLLINTNNTNDKQFTTRCYWFIDLPTTLMVNSSQLVVIDLLIYQQH